MKRLHSIAFLTLLLPFAAQASYSYSWFEVGYIGDAELETTTGRENGDGVDVRVNFLAGDNLYITGYIDEIESNDTRQDMDSFGIGFGWHNDFEANVGLFATLTYEDVETPLKNDDGLGVAAGIRYNVQEDFEAYGGIKYAKYADSDGRFINIGGVWSFSQNYALVAEYTTGDYTFDDILDEFDREQVRLALRVQF